MFEEIQTKDFPKWMNNIKPQIQDALQTPNRVKKRKTSPLNENNKT